MSYLDHRMKNVTSREKTYTIILRKVTSREKTYTITTRKNDIPQKNLHQNGKVMPN